MKDENLLIRQIESAVKFVQSRYKTASNTDINYKIGWNGDDLVMNRQTLLIYWYVKL